MDDTATQLWDRDIRMEWSLSQNAFAPDDEGLWEVLLTLSNGRYGCRGNLELPSAHRQPGVYLAGLYDKPDAPENAETLGLELRNKAITPAYAVAPLWNLVELEAGGVPVDFLNASILAFSRTLDMKRGLLFSTYELEDSAGRTTRLRFLSAALLTDPHLFVMRGEVEALDHEAEMTLRSRCEQPDTPQYFRLNSLLDVEDLHFDKNTREGIHAACTGGACLSAFLGYGGISLRDGQLQANPTLPEQWTSMQFQFLFRGRHVRVVTDKSGTRVHT